MRLFWLVPLLLCACNQPVRASTEPYHTTYSEEDSDSSKDNDTTQEADSIIPRNVGVNISTQPVTPVTEFPEKNQYDQALTELDQATFLAQAGDHEAASDLALQAYDDLWQVHVRRPRKKRAKLHAERYKAATLYMNVSIAYIRDYVKSLGSTPQALEEGKARLGDLKDVAHDYPDLLHWWARLMDQYPASLENPKN